MRVFLKSLKKKTKHTNFMFSNGIDFIYELFNLDRKIKNNVLNNILKQFGKNKNLNNIFIKLAGNGLNI